MYGGILSTAVPLPVYPVLLADPVNVGFVVTEMVPAAVTL